MNTAKTHRAVWIVAGALMLSGAAAIAAQKGVLVPGSVPPRYQVTHVGIDDNQTSGTVTLSVPIADNNAVGSVSIGNGADEVVHTIDAGTGHAVIESTMGGGSMFIGPTGITEVSASEAGNTFNLTVGLFVTYAAGSLTLADCRYWGQRATHYIYAIDGSNLVLVSAADGMNLQYTSGRGTDGDGVLYLWREGKVTDQISDLRKTDGRRQSNVSFVQIVGSRVGTVSGGNGDSRVFVSEPER